MTREVGLPFEFSGLQGRVQYVTRRGTTEFSSSCPDCHGEIHQDGTYPDRFRMFLKSAATGKPLGWCRSCGYTWWPGKDDGREWRPTPEQHKAWVIQREISERERAATAAHAIDLLQQEQVWLKYHDQLTDDVRDVYRKRGIADFWVEYLKLGYNPAKWYRHNGENYVGAALTIPVFEPGGTWRVLNVKNRLTNPVDPGDKYRPEVAGLPVALYVTEPEAQLRGRCMLVEGEFKAIVTYTTLDDPDTLVIGLPSKSPDTDLLAKLAECDPIIICLDPDGYRADAKQHKPAIERLTAALGKRSRVMRLPEKIDDLINAGHIDTPLLRRMVAGARRAM